MGIQQSCFRVAAEQGKAKRTKEVGVYQVYFLGFDLGTCLNIPLVVL